MARPQAFERELCVATAGVEPAAVSKLLAQVARKALADVQRSGQAPKTYVKAVNGRVGAEEETVIPPGPILYEFSWLPEVEEFCLNFGRSPRSPEKSGRYKREFFSLVNGADHRRGDPIPPDAELIIATDVEYATKIEVGKKKDGRPFVVQVPPNVFLDMRQAVMRRFGNVIRAERRFINLAGGRSRKRARNYPALVVTMRD